MSTNLNRIGIGTAQFGLNYGISNRTGQVAQNEVARILKMAHGAGIDTLDTAALYGDSETVLGDTLGSNNRFKLVTKTVGIDADEVTNKELYRIQQTVEKSLVRLNTDNVYGLIVHDANDLFLPGSQKLIALLKEYRQAGTVKKIGASIYTAEQLDRVLERFTPDLVQLPGSILDQRLIQSGHLKKLKRLGVEIHMRSIFLQGLILMPPDSIDPYFESAVPHLENYHASLNDSGLTPLQAALQFALSLEEVDRVIVGICSSAEMKGIIEAAETDLPADFDFNQFAYDDPLILNPADWRLIPELV